MSDVIDFRNCKAVFHDDDVMNYDVARDIIGYVIAIYSEKIYAAQYGKDADEDIAKRLLAERSKIIDAKMNLRLEDRDAVKKAIEYYGKIAKDLDKEETDA